MTDSGRQWRKWVVGLLLAAAVLAVFGPALRYDFISFDDHDYITYNPGIQHGLNWPSIKWALTTGHAANWHPLTWVSHMVDYQLYGLNPTGHHLTSLLLHMVNAVMLLFLLNRLTGSFWPSAFVAAMFALHPMRVESVVWVSERKDVLSSFFWMLTGASYVRYAEEFKVQGSKFKVFYALALVFFAFGLMSKPMLVTLPFVLLLLDYWPLGRWEFGSKFSWRPLVEKIPFFLLAAGDGVVTFLVQKSGGAVASLAKFPLSLRLANIPFAYVRYISKNFWPLHLAIYYPSRFLGLPEVAGAICILGAVSYLVWQSRRAKPYLVVGWLWFLGMLVPTIGIVQVSTQSMADRYSYLPSIGLWIMVAWGARDWIANRADLRAATTVAGGIAVAACLVLTSIQVHYWRSTRDLFLRAAEVTDQYYLAYYNIACYAVDQGQYLPAIGYYKKALGAEPDGTLWSDHSRAYNDLGYAYLHEGDVANAVTNFERALTLRPRYPQAYYNMGRAFLTNHQPDVAVDCFQRALALDQNPAVLGALASAYAAEGNFSKAVAAVQRAHGLALNQNNPSLAGALDAQLRKYQNADGSARP